MIIAVMSLGVDHQPLDQTQRRAPRRLATEFKSRIKAEIKIRGINVSDSRIYDMLGKKRSGRGNYINRNEMKEVNMEARQDIQMQEQEAKSWPKVAIIVLNWNGWRDTIECLESLQRITYPNYQIIVVDNGSTDGSMEKIKAWARGEITVESKFFEYNPASKPVQWIEYDRKTAEVGGMKEKEVELDRIAANLKLALIQAGENLGFAGGNNVALRYAMKREFPLMLLLNNDTVVEPLFLTLLVKALDFREDWMAVGPKILYKNDPKRIWYAGAKLQVWRANCAHIGIDQMDDNRWSGMHATDHVSGCCLLAKRQLFENVGLLDEDFFFGNEDWAYSCVLRTKGLKVGVSLDAKILHKSGGSLEQGNPICTYYYNKNRLIVLKKYGSLTEKFLGYSSYVITRLPKFGGLLGRGELRLIRSELKAILDFLLGRYGDYDRKRANSHV